MVPSSLWPALRAKGMGSLLISHSAGLPSLQAKAHQKSELGHPKKDWHETELYVTPPFPKHHLTFPSSLQWKKISSFPLQPRASGHHQWDNTSVVPLCWQQLFQAGGVSKEQVGALSPANKSYKDGMINFQECLRHSDAKLPGAGAA